MVSTLCVTCDKDFFAEYFVILNSSTMYSWINHGGVNNGKKNTIIY